MSQFYLIGICFFIGFGARYYKLFPENTAQVLNKFVIYISLPALTLKLLTQVEIHSAQIPAVMMAWILFVFGIIFFKLAAFILPMSAKTQGTLILTGSLGNTSFVGFPLLEALIGTSALVTGVVVDQPGTFLVTGTLGVFLASLYAGQKVSLQTSLKKIFLFPPFLAVLLSMALIGTHIPQDVYFLWDKFSATLIPLSLVSVGFQLKVERSHLQREWKFLALGLFFKLILAPLFFAILYLSVFHLKDQQTLIIILESAMAPMITAGILASEYGLNSDLSSLMVGVGIPLSLLTVPAWKWILALWI